MDLVVETPRVARRGETFVGRRFYTAPGGKGANQAVAAARFAADAGSVAMIGAVGDDQFGQQLRTFLKTEGIDVDAVRSLPDTSSGIAVIFAYDDGENSVNAVYGANGQCGEPELSAFEGLGDGATLLVQQEVPLAVTAAAVEHARTRGIRVVLDPAPAHPRADIPDGFYAGVDFLTPNETEAEALTGIAIADVADAEKAARQIVAEHGCGAVTLTMGERGTLALIDGIAVHLPPHDVEVLASVAAGDAFAGVMGQALSEGVDAHEAVRLASAAGALCVTKPGAQQSMPRRSEVFELACIRDPLSATG